jgi:hypothetical protein
VKADTVDLAAIFGKPVHYLVPLYQRPYVWTREDQWEPLWQDVVEVAERLLDDTPANDAIPHFLGAVVLEQALVPSGMIEARLVIDGQQRLATLQLLIAAARSLAIERGLDDPRQMFEKLLFNEQFLVKRPGDELKVVPTFRDRVPFRESMGDGVVASTGGHRIHQAYRFFRNVIREWAEEGGADDGYARRLDALSTAIWKRLIVVTIDLDRGDNAQVIFETLNARGTPLLAADLIKNHLFQTATIQGTDVDALYEQYWHVLDTDWWREDVKQGRLTRPRLDIFLNHWLAMSTGTEVVSHQLFPEFKRYLASGKKQAADVLADLARYGLVYAKFENEPRTTEMGQFLDRLNVMDVTTAYPALLWLLGPEGMTDERERGPALRAIESWLVRRMLTRQTTKNYNVVFLALLRHARQAAKKRGSAPLAADVAEYLAGLRGESQFWPKAKTVRAALESLPIYLVLSQNRLRMVLGALEEGMYTGLTEKVQLPPSLTIEHVLPQDWEREWPLPSGADSVQARFQRDEAKHRLGNLTLATAKLNPKMSNGPWPVKRQALQQYSVLLISADIRSAETWDEESIARRGTKLTDTALSVWARPDDDADEAAASLEAPPSRAAGAPDSEDPAAFAEVLAIADEVGVGDEIRRIVQVAREIGLVPRPDRQSVMVSPPDDKRWFLFTVKPQWDEGGSFKIWKSAERFAQWVPGVSLEQAQAALGASEEEGVLFAADVDAFLEIVGRLVPPEWAAPSFDERRAELLQLGIENLERVPGVVLRLIDRRAKNRPEIALRFAAAALGLDGVMLRGQESIHEPWYFQVRHPKVSSVVAYAHPFPGELRVEYRLPSTHDTYGLATARKGDYGIALVARDDQGLESALHLLRDAIDRAENMGAGTHEMRADGG